MRLYGYMVRILAAHPNTRHQMIPAGGMGPARLRFSLLSIRGNLPKSKRQGCLSVDATPGHLRGYGPENAEMPATPLQSRAARGEASR